MREWQKEARWEGRSWWNSSPRCSIPSSSTLRWSEPISYLTIVDQENTSSSDFHNWFLLCRAYHIWPCLTIYLIIFDHIWPYILPYLTISYLTKGTPLRLIFLTDSSSVEPISNLLKERASRSKDQTKLNIKCKYHQSHHSLKFHKTIKITTYPAGTSPTASWWTPTNQTGM